MTFVVYCKNEKDDDDDDNYYYYHYYNVPIDLSPLWWEVGA